MKTFLTAGILMTALLTTPTAAVAEDPALEKRIEELIRVLEKTHKDNQQRFGNLEDRIDRIEKRLDGGYTPPSYVPPAPSYRPPQTPVQSYAPPPVARTYASSDRDKYSSPTPRELTPQNAAVFAAIMTSLRPAASPSEQRAIDNLVTMLRKGPPIGTLSNEDQEAIDNLFTRLTR